MKERIRKCDQFGAQVKLHLNGESDHGTTLGGIFTLLIRILIGSYFCMRVLAVKNF